jgi:hypothetical protein
LIKLGILLEYQKDLKPISLKCFFYAFKMAKKMNDAKKIEFMEQKITEFYDNNQQFLVYNNELKVICDEFTMISNYNKSKKPHAANLLNEVQNIKRKNVPPIEKKEIMIDGTKVMKILNIKQGELVGLILKKIEERILDGTMENEESKIITFLKSIDLSKLKNEGNEEISN